MNVGDRLIINNVVYQVYEDGKQTGCNRCEVQKHCKPMEMPYCRSKPIHFVTHDTAAIRRLRGEHV